nr:hypothetical protein [Lentzea aerocolonigenes]
MPASVTSGTNTVAPTPKCAAMRATARPWLPSVAVTSETPGCRASTW